MLVCEGIISILVTPPKYISFIPEDSKLGEQNPERPIKAEQLWVVGVSALDSGVGVAMLRAPDNGLVTTLHRDYNPS